MPKGERRVMTRARTDREHDTHPRVTRPVPRAAWSS